MKHKTDLLGTFAHHKVAANLLMFMMLLGGVFALGKLNIQFFPNFELDIITVRVVWSGAGAEDVETGITTPLEQTLRTVDNLHKITSTSAQGMASISLELVEGTDPVVALNQVKQKVDEFRNLPADAEEPEVMTVSRYEQVARLLIYGTDDIAELRRLANAFERQLLDKGIDKVDINGLPDEEIAIEISNQNLQRLGLSLDEIGDRIGRFSRDIPAGTFGEGESATELRSLDQRRDELGFARVPIISDENSRVYLGSVAKIERRAEKGGVALSVYGRPAVELVVRRAESGDSFEAASTFKDWIHSTTLSLPEGIQIHVYDESWKLIDERIALLLKNGGGGLVLVLAILYLFLTYRVAWWVALGIPVSFMATLLVMYLSGGSINMISLFALIMALGIIVDDAVVVGEDALAHYQAGEAPLLAAEGGARRMLAPVIASSLTTVAAFIPLMLIGGPTGKILFAIPMVIVAVILASVVESFFILPGHLRHAFLHMHREPEAGWRARFDAGFDRFRNESFRRLVGWALNRRLLALSLVTSILIVAGGLLAGGHIRFTFFPTVESTMVYANASFVPGTPRADVKAFLRHLENTLRETDRALSPEPLVATALARLGSGLSGRGRADQTGDHFGALTVELIEPDLRTVRNVQFIRGWRDRISFPAGLENLTITIRMSGPPGRDLSIRLTGKEAETLKQAATELAQTLNTIPGVSDVEDDMPFGREQLVYRLTPAGEILGLTTAELGRQLRTAFDGRLIQLFQDGPNEVEVRIKLPETERRSLNALGKLEIRLPTGQSVPLSQVAEWQRRRGFEILRHAEGRLAVEVSAEVNTSVNNANQILASFDESVLPTLSTRYGISYSFEGRSADQAETLGDMKKGLFIGLTLIYLVLAWVFASYGWPLVVMTAIPFGLIGAILGHLILGIDLTILSLFGFFGLSGIVVNDSIILVSFYKRLRDQGLEVRDALIEASCQRLRAVLLTSLTTIAGLAPLLFETSLQAQFLIPMAASIAFGLAFATLLVLVVIPVLLSLYEEFHAGHAIRKALAIKGGSK